MRAFIFFKFVTMYYAIYIINLNALNFIKKEKPRKFSESNRLWYKPDSVFVNHLSKSIIAYRF